MKFENLPGKKFIMVKRGPKFSTMVLIMKLVESKEIASNLNNNISSINNNVE